MGLLDNKVILITGGTRGIGKTMVKEFIKQGAKVSFTFSGSVDRANALEAEMNKNGAAAKAWQADATNLSKAEEVVAGTVETFGKLDVVVNNAGIAKDNLILRMTEEQWDDVILTNLKSVFNYTKAAVKIMMKQRDGVFINISSVVGLDGNGGQSNYAASKAGIIGFTKSIAKEMASRNIRANAVAPGFISTEMTEVIPQAEMEKWLSDILLKRAGSTQDVANLCAFLASDRASYITGQTIRLDGGL